MQSQSTDSLALASLKFCYQQSYLCLAATVARLLNILFLSLALPGMVSQRHAHQLALEASPTFG